MRPFGSKSDGKTLQLVQRGTDKRIPVELVKQPSGEVLDPAELEGLHVMVSSESGGGIATIPHTIEDKKLVVEVTADISRQLGLGVYTMTATGRIPDPAYADGYHDYEIVVALCNVTKYGSNETPVKVTANVLEGLKGKDGLNNYQLAVKHGYQGTEEQFAKDIIPKSNYERAKELQGFQGTEVDYLVSLHGAPGESIYDIAVRRGFVGSEQVYLESQKGKDGKDAYQTYLETTTDSTPMTKKQWANANDFFYQLIFRILKGAGVKPTETDMTADQVYELDRQRREIISAIRSKGVPARDTDGIGELARLINEIHAPMIDIFKEQQLLDWVSDEFPALRVYRGYAPASLRYMLGRCSRLKRMPTLMEVDEVVDISYMCLSCTSMTSAQLPIMGKVTTAASAFNGCVLLESLEIGGLPLCKHLNSLVSGCKALKSLSLGDCSNVELIDQMAVGCVNLTDVTAVFGGSLKSMNMSFYGCSSLRKVDAIMDLSECGDVGNAFTNCTSLEEVRLKGLKVSIDLSTCTKLSIDSARYLLENVQTVSGKRIDLSRKLLEANEEALGDLGDTASDKGWTINYK
jgi:PHIKZ145|nr:MAG TPA: tail sheath protein [Caudoviricetes sp.]